MITISFVRKRTLLLIVTTVCAASIPARAAFNVANGAPVIGGSGDYPGVAFNGGAPFASYNVTDGQNATPDNNTGAIYEFNADDSYWLSPESPSGYFVLDLGAAYPIGQIQIFNTRNGQYEDRGTGDFRISAANSVAPGVPGTGFDLVGGVQIASGTLTPQTYAPFGFGSFAGMSTVPLVPDLFTASNAGPFRYIRFDALSIGATNRFGFGLNGVGLNEIRIFERLPEPTAAVILALVGGCGWVGRRRIKSAFDGLNI